MIDPEVLAVLGEETDELLKNLSVDISGLAPGVKDDKLLEPIFRLAHTLKGTAAQFGMPEITEASKKIESLAKAIRSGEKELNQENINLLKIELEDLKKICQSPKF